MPITLMADQQAVLSGYSGGKKAVLAAPGAGKTTLIAHLIAHWIRVRQIPARQILVLTFTESAAREFEQRTLALLDPLAEPPTFSTIHSFCNRLLRQLQSDFSDRSVASEERRYAIIGELLEARGLRTFELDYTRLVADVLMPRYRQQAYLQQPHNTEDIARWTGAPSEHSELLVALPELIAAYEQRLSEARLLDYDMMISATYHLLQTAPRLVKSLQARYHYLFEDEAQDSNPLQAALLSLITGPEGHLLRVGDPNQSIYAFSGADYRSLQAYGSRHGLFPMAQSNRSSAGVMQLANQFHQAYASAFPSPVMLQPGVNNPPDGWIWVKPYATVQAEMQALIQACGNLLEQDQSVAILCRTNLSCQWLHEQLTAARLPSVLHHDRSDHFFQSDIVKQVSLMLEYLLHPDAFHLLQQVLVELGVSRTTLQLLLDTQLPLREALTQLAQGWVFHAAVPSTEYQRLITLAGDLLFLIDHLHYPIADLLEWLAERLLPEPEQRARLRLLHALWAQAQDTPVQGIEAFQTWLQQAGQKRIRQALIPLAAEENLTTRGVIHLLTAHKAKGLEWDGVLLPLFQFGQAFSGADLELRVLLRALQTGEPYQAVLDSIALEEEQENIRLVYVALTRARRFVSITASQAACRPAGIYQNGLSPLFETLYQLYRNQRPKEASHGSARS
ncbi:MAG: ATP-dependent helicase [Candidatus Sericytochromatia bacterium]